MFGLIRPILLATVLWLPVSAFAEREVHVVSLVNGRDQPGYVLAVPDTEIYVDRPGQSVTLVLVSRTPLKWNVSHSDGTLIESILLGGDALSDTQLTLSGITMDAETFSGLPITTQPIGAPFRRLVSNVTDHIGLDAINSFYGRYDAPDTPITIDTNFAQLDAFNPNYLSSAIGPLGDVPHVLRDWQNHLPRGPIVRFDAEGVQLGDDALLEVTEDVPPIFLPQAAVYDPIEEMIYAMSLGGVGYVYRVDRRTGVWDVFAELDGFDGAQMHFDHDGQRLILTGAFGRPGEILVLGLDGSADTFTLPVQMFAGLTDLYDYGQDDPPSLVPLETDGDWVLLSASTPPSEAYRIYALNLANRNIRLLAYRNAF